MELHAKHNFFFLVSASFLCAVVVADLQAPVVHTKLGSLKGEYVSVKGKETGVHAYLGVPFAKPPLGPSLRLAPPQPVGGWEGVRDATKQPPMCIQSKEAVLDLVDKLGGLLAEIPDISEDCLYLNIYTPAKRANNAKLPVMVWIHGGGFTLGSASTYDGSALAAYQDVVVVLIQYRLGLLGFLSTGDEHISGNFGLLDQVEALKWIQQHIHNFGGDPGLVTIFGESAGGVSVSLLVRIYSYTGDEHISGNFGLLDQVEALKWIQQHIHNFGGDPGLVTIFGESAGGVSVSLLLSFFYPDPKAAFIRDVIADEYIGNGDDRVKNRDGYTEMLGDLFFTIPAIKAANAHRDAGAPVYLYEYQHPPKFLQQKRPSFVGTDHGDEIFTVLGFCFTTSHVRLPDPCPEDEEQLSKIMMSYWGNFARTGSPDGHNLVHWPKYGAEEKYLAIGLKKQVTAQHLKKERFVFLTQTVPEKIKQHEENAERSEL
ncbi:liver carboxylesterase 1F-like [Haplochromis burtoni]|uniref:liver carboxylesterase 1F-like n=1 Tax=Haplochromis burtoni TaxID=8153 RepID=UPI001C2CFC82|nr:liver carboxylesterase 1F-like [Haplochromis burtoni]